MTWLSRLMLDPRQAAVAEAVADCHAMHRRVLQAFPDVEGGRAGLGVLHRLEVGRTGVRLLVQSGVEPQWTPLCASGFVLADEVDKRDLAPLLARLDVGTACRFRLLANTTKRLANKPDGSRDGRRVPLRDEASCREWLARRAASSGFEVGDLVFEPTGRIRGRRAGKRLTFEGARFDGTLRVTDPAGIREAIRTGLGPAKAYGFGLLSVAPIA